MMMMTMMMMMMMMMMMIVFQAECAGCSFRKDSTQDTAHPAHDAAHAINDAVECRASRVGGKGRARVAQIALKVDGCIRLRTNVAGSDGPGSALCADDAGECQIGIAVPAQVFEAVAGAVSGSEGGSGGCCCGQETVQCDCLADVSVGAGVEAEAEMAHGAAHGRVQLGFVHKVARRIHGQQEHDCRGGEQARRARHHLGRREMTGPDRTAEPREGQTR
jgi:hypothetical protein